MWRRSHSFRFVIIDDFITITKALQAENLVRLLNIIYTQFDEITEQLDVYKIETVCEVYMCCVGCPYRAIDHADKSAACALTMMHNMNRVRQMFVEQLTDDEGQLDCCKNLNIKIGINSGKIVAGVLNTPATIRFKLFGDTVNTASRMQSTSEPGKIQVSEKTFKKLVGGTQHKAYVFSPPRQVQAKGKGVMNTWFVERMRSEQEVTAMSRAAMSSGDDEDEKDEKDEKFVDAAGNEIVTTGSVAGKIRSKLGILTHRGDMSGSGHTSGSSYTSGAGGGRRQSAASQNSNDFIQAGAETSGQLLLDSLMQDNVGEMTEEEEEEEGITSEDR